ncbi:MAG: TIR domain-containing protein [Candidatus Gracilibacteria bacterium]|nr:TIR domain-containing protein [Candidatus Gracilibacteria bacterium]
MARRAFFSFHYERDVWRAGQVRNSWVTKDREAAGFWDAASWEEVKKKGEEEVKKWIRKQLEGTSVTVVLIGAETSSREYVKYELEQSWERGNGILGIYIHQMKDKDGKTDTKGKNEFGPIFKSDNDDKQYFFQRFSTYDWVDNDGYNDMGDWIESAAKKAGK